MICLMIDNQCRLLNHPYVYHYYYSSYLNVKVKSDIYGEEYCN